MRDLDGEVVIESMPSIIGRDPCDFLTAAAPRGDELKGRMCGAVRAR
jgi:hypothetical protein